MTKTGTTKKEFKTTKTVIAAQPGFDTVTLQHDPYGFSYTPIVAWCVDAPETYGDVLNHCASAIPICMDWNYNNGDNSIIRQPNGDIVFADGPTFSKGHEAEALAYAVERYEADRAIRASRAISKVTA